MPTPKQPKAPESPARAELLRAVAAAAEAKAALLQQQARLAGLVKERGT